MTQLAFAHRLLDSPELMADFEPLAATKRGAHKRALLEGQNRN